MNNLKTQGQGWPAPHHSQQLSVQSARPSARKRLTPLMGLTLVIAALLIIAGVVSFIWQQYAPPGQGSVRSGQTSVDINAPSPTPMPTPTPTLTEHQRYQQLARKYVDKLSLDDMIGQLLIVNPYSLGDDLTWMVSKQHVSGVIFYTYSLEEKAVVQQRIQRLQGVASTPLFMATDGEGGEIYRLANIYPDDPFLLGDQIRATGDPQVAIREGQKLAQRFKSLGLNTSFSPTVDVYASQDSYMYYRSLGKTPDDVIKYTAPYLSALQQGGVIGTLKHYPGMGRASDDPHADTVKINATKDDFYKTDLAPFKYFAQTQKPYEQPGMIMTTYALVSSIDDQQPGQFSHKFVTEILRQEFGYDGVVVTDDLGNMVPAARLGIGPASILSLQAGCDLLLGPRNSDEVAAVVQAIKDALANGSLTNERLRASAIRIITLKLEYKILTEAAVG